VTSGPGVRVSRPPSDGVVTPRQDQRYKDLVVQNIAHFAAGGTAIETWTSHHQDALFKAVEAGPADDSAAQQIALATEAFGEHFLTDAISGGDGRTPRAAILDWYSKVFGPKAIFPLIDDLRARLVRAFADQIGAQLPKSIGSAVPSVAEMATQQAEAVIMMIAGGDVLAVGGNLES
jgi:hypothetical protein